MTKFFEATVQVMVESTDAKGNAKYKRVKKKYIVDSVTVTEAEARVVKVFAELGGVKEFNVEGVSGSKLVSAVLLGGDTSEDSRFYEVTVEIKIESSTSKDEVRVKKIKETYLVETDSPRGAKEAEQTVYDMFRKNGFTNDFEIDTIKRSKIVEVISPDTTELRELPEGKWMTKSLVEEKPEDADADDNDADDNDADDNDADADDSADVSTEL